MIHSTLRNSLGNIYNGHMRLSSRTEIHYGMWRRVFIRDSEVYTIGDLMMLESSDNTENESSNDNVPIDIYSNCNISSNGEMQYRNDIEHLICFERNKINNRFIILDTSDSSLIVGNNIDEISGSIHKIRNIKTVEVMVSEHSNFISYIYSNEPDEAKSGDVDSGDSRRIYCDTIRTKEVSIEISKGASRNLRIRTDSGVYIEINSRGAEISY